MGAAANQPTRHRRSGRRRGRISDINVTPFVDVMLVLLIVFMVTAPLLTSGIAVDLPNAQAKPLPADSQPLTVTIRADGTIFLQETEVQFADLPAQLEAISRTGYDQRIFIRADAKSDWQTIARVMAKVKDAGYRKVGLVTEPLER